MGIIWPSCHYPDRHAKFIIIKFRLPYQFLFDHKTGYLIAVSYVDNRLTENFALAHMPVLL